MLNEREGLLPDVTSQAEFASLPTKDKLAARSALWGNREYIDAYVRENPDRMPAEDLQIVQRWTAAVVGEFYIHRFLKQHTIFLGESSVYAVVGLYDPLPYIYRERPLPIMVKAVLLPFKGRIVYDGVFETYSIQFGSGIRAELQRFYMAAKRKGQIITSLDNIATTPQIIRQRPRLSEDSKAAAAEIAAASTRLRSGDTLTRNVFQLLQTSASLAQAVAQDPENLAELWRLYEPISKALGRTYRALQRAEDSRAGDN